MLWWHIICPDVPIILGTATAIQLRRPESDAGWGDCSGRQSRSPVEALKAGKDTILWDSELTGFGVRIHPSGTKAFIVNYRTGDGGRKAPNKRVVIGRYGPVTADRARKLAHEVLGKVAGGNDPAGDRAEARGMPTLDHTFEQYMAANPNRSKRTNELYRYEANRYLGDWLTRPLDAISRADVEARFNSITADHGWSAANRAMSLLRSIYRRPCVDHDGLRNPVDLWLAGGGKFHRKARRKISAPAEVLPCWRAGIEAEVNNPAIRDALWFGLYTGMRRDEVLTLRWEWVDMDAQIGTIADIGARTARNFPSPAPFISTDNTYIEAGTSYPGRLACRQ